MGGGGGGGLEQVNYFYKESKSKRILRGAVVEWLEQLGYSAESRRIGSASPCGDWKTLSVNPAVNGNLFRIREG